MTVLDTTALNHLLERQIDLHRLPGFAYRIRINGEVVAEAARGLRSPQASDAMRLDTIFRVYSMTKPITSVAALMLLEAGQLTLDDPLSRHFPEFKQLMVGIEEAGPDGAPVLRLAPARKEATVRDLLRHTAGFTYGIFEKSLVKDEYFKAGIEGEDYSNQDLIARLATVPLAYEPGTMWEYSRATDVLGALVERLSGESLGAFFKRRIFEPLAMVDTGFAVPPGALDRLAEPFAKDPDSGSTVRVIDARTPRRFESGGGGLFSTIGDYERFQDMLIGRGTAHGVTLLKPETVDAMVADHLGSIARSPAYLPGPDRGFGLGVAVRTVARNGRSVGEYGWGGLAGTYQWVDPGWNMSAVYMMQAPAQRLEFRELFVDGVYQALVATRTS